MTGETFAKKLDGIYWFIIFLHMQFGVLNVDVKSDATPNIAVSDVKHVNYAGVLDLEPVRENEHERPLVGVS